ncbi:hypothetical protein AGMMS50233_10770 [Endomicrobiia bacterium]|nr:hypothetical protein AGMMS50233_10770 [Endomicrobiia bacterium]
MKKLLFLVSLVLTVFAANVFAVDVDLGFGVGQFVSRIKSLKVVREQLPVRLQLNHDSSPLMFNVDCLFGVSENVKIGPRIAFFQNSADLTLPDAKVRICGKIDPNKHPMYSQTSAVLVPVMLGGSYNQKLDERSTIFNGKLFLGIGFINTTTCRYTGSFDGTTDKLESGSNLMMLPNTSVEKSARCFVANPSIGVHFEFPKDARVGLDVGLDVGYLYTPATKSGFKDIKLDFSGFTVNLGLTIKI